MNMFKKLLCKTPLEAPPLRCFVELPQPVIDAAIVGIKQQLRALESGIVCEQQHAEACRLRAVEADKTAMSHREKSWAAREKAGSLMAQRAALVETLNSMGETWS